jgi:hypothetical protein
MTKFFNKLSIIFAAGSFGGLMKGIFAWLFGAIGISAVFGVKYAPLLTPEWIYSHLVWGGIWALLFFLPSRGLSPYTLGLLYSLPQTLMALFIRFPKMNKGMLGLELGALTPLFILFYGAIWGIATALWLKWSQKS